MTKRERREAKAQANAGGGGFRSAGVVAGIMAGLVLLTMFGTGARLNKWNNAEGVVKEAYTLEEDADGQKAGSYAVIVYTDETGVEHEATAMELVSPMDGQEGETVDVQYTNAGNVRVKGNYFRDDTTRNLILAMVAVIAVYALSELIKAIFPPEMVYEKLRGAGKKKK